MPLRLDAKSMMRVYSIAQWFGSLKPHIKRGWQAKSAASSRRKCSLDLHWELRLPDGLNFADAGPLLCGGITVFNPIAIFATPKSRVGVIGIGGLGHMALEFAAAYGCDVTAFTSRESKFDEARDFGARHVVATRDSAAIAKLANSFDLLIVTVNVSLDWEPLINSLAANGRMHVVGAVLEPIPIPVFPLLMRQGSVGASPTGSPVDMADMLAFRLDITLAPKPSTFQ